MLSIFDLPLEIIIYHIIPHLDCKSCVIFFRAIKQFKYLLHDRVLLRYNFNDLIDNRVMHNFMDEFDKIIAVENKEWRPLISDKSTDEKLIDYNNCLTTGHYQLYKPHIEHGRVMSFVLDAEVERLSNLDEKYYFDNVEINYNTEKEDTTAPYEIGYKGLQDQIAFGVKIVKFDVWLENKYFTVEEYLFDVWLETKPNKYFTIEEYENDDVMTAEYDINPRLQLEYDGQWNRDTNGDVNADFDTLMRERNYG